MNCAELCTERKVTRSQCNVRIMCEGRTERNEHIYPTMKRRYTYENKWYQ